METKTLYCVYQASGNYEDYRDRLIGIFDSLDLAEKCKSEFDKRVIGYDEDIYKYVPEEIYDEFPFDVDVYKGYARELLEKQERLVSLQYDGYRPCRIVEKSLNPAIKPLEI